MQLFDNTGRRIPSAGLHNVNVVSESHYLDQPMTWYLPSLCRHNRLKSSFTYSASLFGSAHDFACRSKALINQIRQNRAVAGVLNGIHLPICLPQLKVKDYGETLDDVFVTAVKRSFGREFHGRQLFENSLAAHLPKNLTILPESRHRLLIERMEHGPVVGIYYPAALQGFSVQAAREQMADLPQNFLLSGGIDVATAMAMYPDVLGRDESRGHMRPSLILAGLSFSSDGEQRLNITNWDSMTYLDDVGTIYNAFADSAPGLLVLEDNQ